MSVGKSILLLFGLLVLALVILVFVRASTDSTRISVEDVRSKIERELPKGTPADAIILWLEEENEYDLQSQGLAHRYSRLQDRGVPPGTGVIFASIWDTGRDGLFTTKLIDIWFLLGEQNELTDTIVSESGVGL